MQSWEDVVSINFDLTLVALSNIQIPTTAYANLSSLTEITLP